MEHDSPSFLTLITKLQGHSAFGLCFRRIPGFRQILRGPVSRPVFAPPPPPATHKTNKQAKLTLLFTLFYFLLWEFSFYRLIQTTDFLLSPSQMFYELKKAVASVILQRGLVTKLYSLTRQWYGIGFLSAYFITTAVSSSQFKVSSTTWGLFVVFAFKIKVSIIFKMKPWNY